MKIELELPEIEGYEYTGEYRRAEKGDFFYHRKCSAVVSAGGTTVLERPILRKKAPVYLVLDIDADGRTVTPFQAAGHRLVEIKALEDALKLVDEYRANRFPTDHAPIYKALKEVLND
jgi:hypothetical protein